MACASEAHGHGHGHEGEDHAEHHDHSHDDDDVTRGALFSLFQYIDTPRVRVLNAGSPDMTGCEPFKPFDRRTETGAGSFLESDEDDPEMILFVPFTASVRVRALIVIGGGGGQSPRHVKIFANRERMDFATANATQPLQ